MVFLFSSPNTKKSLQIFNINCFENLSIAESENNQKSTLKKNSLQCIYVLHLSSPERSTSKNNFLRFYHKVYIF